MAMRNIYIGLLLLLNTTTAMVARNYRQAVQVDGIECIHANREVTVKFSLQASVKIVKSDYTLIVMPVLKNNEDSICLPEITISGKRAHIAEARNLLATDRKRGNSSLSMKNGERLSYEATVPYQEWMQKAQLVFNGMRIGCCSVTEVEIGVVAENILPDQSQTFVQPEMQKQQTTGDLLSDRFPFLASTGTVDQATLADWDKSGNTNNRASMETFVNNNREGALKVYFVQGGRVIDRAYKNNHEALVKLVSVVRAIETSSDSRIAYIVIAGFASPEGTLSFNEQLAWDRGIALSRFVARYTSLSSNKIYVYGGSVDWTGLRSMVENSDMYERNRILNIIDAPEWNSDNRLNRLISLSGGGPYHYMLNNFFPLLRNAAYVKVYYENL